MKKLIFLFVLFIALVPLKAQTYIGGTFNLSTTSLIKEETSFMFGLSPEIGYNLNEKWAIGSTLDFMYITKTDFDNVTAIGLSPYLRATFFKRESFSIFTEGVISYVYTSTGDYGANNFGLAFRPGFSLNISPKVSLIGRTILFSYIHVFNEELNQIKFGVSPNFEIGIAVNI